MCMTNLKRTWSVGIRGQRVVVLHQLQQQLLQRRQPTVQHSTTVHRLHMPPASEGRQDVRQAESWILDSTPTLANLLSRGLRTTALTSCKLSPLVTKRLVTRRQQWLLCRIAREVKQKALGSTVNQHHWSQTDSIVADGIRGNQLIPWAQRQSHPARRRSRARPPHRVCAPPRSTAGR